MRISDHTAVRFEVTVDVQTPESWSGVLAQFADANIYQSWAYGAVRWGVRNLSHLVMHCDGRVLGAAQVRIIRMPLLPTGVAYVRWGPLCQRKDSPPDPRVVEQILSCLRDEYCERRRLVLQVIPNAYPGIARGSSYLKAVANCGFRPHSGLPSYRTVLVDLDPAAEVIRKRLNQKWRNQLNAAEKNGLRFEVTCDPEGYRQFMRLYQIMWDTKQFDTHVDIAEFGCMQEQLAPDDKMWVFLAHKDGQVVGALVCSSMGDTAVYLLGATNDRARELKASYFLHWQAMMWLKKHGVRWYDLGGIDPEANPGGYHFKSGFGGQDITQIPAFWASNGMLGDALNRGITWWRQRQA